MIIFRGFKSLSISSRKAQGLLITEVLYYKGWSSVLATMLTRNNSYKIEGNCPLLISCRWQQLQERKNDIFKWFLTGNYWKSVPLHNIRHLFDIITFEIESFHMVAFPCDLNNRLISKRIRCMIRFFCLVCPFRPRQMGFIVWGPIQSHKRFLFRYFFNSFLIHANSRYCGPGRLLELNMLCWRSRNFPKLIAFDAEMWLPPN